MRCHEAKRRMGEKQENDRELALHLAGCPACALEAEAAGLLDRAVQTTRRLDPAETTSLETIRTRVNAHQAEDGKERFFMAQSNNIFTKKLSLGLGLAVLAFLFVTLVPFSYDRVVGHDLVLSDISGDVQVSPNQMVKALQALGYDNISVNVNQSNSETEVTVNNLPHELAVSEASAAFTALTGIEADTESTPIIKTVSGSLYAQVREQMTIAVTVEGSTPEEIRQNVIAQLAASGFEGSEVTVETDESGQTSISIEMTDDQ
ncbi:MAG: hypothetical protein GY841_06090 [FCB group bacterium]|nr:hypothetical protein [FCB group bacterium]